MCILSQLLLSTPGQMVVYTGTSPDRSDKGFCAHQLRHLKDPHISTWEGCTPECAGEWGGELLLQLQTDNAEPAA